MKKSIQSIIADSIAAKTALLNSEPLINTIHKAVQEIVNAYQQGHKVLFCGNGGSAADAQHIAAELSGRFYLDRRPLYAEALHTNSSYLTAVANDYGYDEVFSRLVRAMGSKGDIFVGISTSGNSTNILRAVETAAELGLTTIGMTGAKGGKMKAACTYLINVPSDDTPRIQECHILIGHIICELVETELFGKQ